MLRYYFDKIRQMPLIRLFSILCIECFIIWIILLFVGFISQGGLFYAENNPGHELFSDFIDPQRWAVGNSTFELNLADNVRMWRCYSPSVCYVFYLLSNIACTVNYLNISNIQILITALYLTFVTCLTVFFIKSHMNVAKIDRILFIMAFLTSSIYLYSFERANIIFITALLSAYFIYNYDSKNKIYKECALISLAIAFVMKFSPAILGLLLLYKRDYKSALRCLLYGLILFILPVFAFPRGLETLITFKENLRLLLNYFESGYSTPTWPVQCLPVGKGILFHIYPEYIGIVNLIVYAIVMLNIFCSFYSKEFWRKVLALVLAIVLVPNISFFYVYLYFLPVVMLYFEACTNKRLASRMDYIYILYFFIILFFQIQIYVDDINLTLWAKHLVLLLMLVQETIYGFYNFVKLKYYS